MEKSKIQLLGYADTGEVGREMPDVLNLLRILRPLGCEGAELTVFLETLRRPPLDPEDIRRRQQVLAVFREHPSMLRELQVIFDEFSRIRGNWDAERAKHFTLRRLNSGDKTSEFYNARLSLQLDARYLKVTILRLQSAAQLIARYRFESEALTELRTAAHDASASPAALRLYEFADKCESSILEAVSYDMEALTDDEVRMGQLILTDFRHTSLTAHPAEPESGGLSAWFRRPYRKKEETPLPPEEICAYMSDLSTDLRHSMRMEAVNETDRRITAAARAILHRFGDIRRELYFFQCALRYCNRMHERGVELVFPEIFPEEAGILRMTGLRDVLLLTESTRPQSVVDNDIDLCRGETGISGMLIRGANSSGKTVFLRSVGTAVLLGLAGLPVPAADAQISIRRSIRALFASAEKELSEHSSAGRFEEEAAALAEILEGITDSSLLLLNETFQSTSYAEGAEGIVPILEHISLLGGSFLFVTHLTELFTLYDRVPGVTLAATSANAAKRYKVERIG